MELEEKKKEKKRCSGVRMEWSMAARCPIRQRKKNNNKQGLRRIT
jgi:hypothetical protein